MLKHDQFCSVISKKINEPVFGTTPFAKYFLLIETNKAFPNRIKNYLEKEFPRLAKIALDCSMRILLIKNKTSKSKSSNDLNAFLIDVDNKKTIKIPDLSTLHSFNLNELRSLNKNEIDEHIYLVCTHGKKDKCCAKYGIPIFNALTSKANYNMVWECSHVGGDRFAPNILIMPYGFYFGALPPTFKIQNLLTSINNNAIPLEFYRGCSNQTRLAQVVNHFIRKEANYYKLDEPNTYEIKALDESTFVAKSQIKNPLTNFNVAIKQSWSEELEFRTCSSLKKSRRRDYSLIEIKTT